MKDGCTLMACQSQVPSPLFIICVAIKWSVGNREHWLWDTARKRNEFLLFSIVLRILQLLKTYEPLVRFRWGFQQNVSLQMSTSIKYKTENVTCLTSDWYMVAWFGLELALNILILLLCSFCYLLKNKNKITKIKTNQSEYAYGVSQKKQIWTYVSISHNILHVR